VTTKINLILFPALAKIYHGGVEGSRFRSARSAFCIPFERARSIIPLPSLLSRPRPLPPCELAGPCCRSPFFFLRRLFFFGESARPSLFRCVGSFSQTLPCRPKFQSPSSSICTSKLCADHRVSTPWRQILATSSPFPPSKEAMYSFPKFFLIWIGRGGTLAIVSARQLSLQAITRAKCPRTFSRVSPSWVFSPAGFKAWPRFFLTKIEQPLH